MTANKNAFMRREVCCNYHDFIRVISTLETFKLWAFNAPTQLLIGFFMTKSNCMLSWRCAPNDIHKPDFVSKLQCSKARLFIHTFNFLTIVLKYQFWVLINAIIDNLIAIANNQKTALKESCNNFHWHKVCMTSFSI